MKGNMEAMCAAVPPALRNNYGCSTLNICISAEMDSDHTIFDWVM